MFRTPYAHRQEDYIVNAALYGMLFIHLSKQPVMLKDVLSSYLYSEYMQLHVRDKFVSFKADNMFRPRALQKLSRM
jgi:hypothetical protein